MKKQTLLFTLFLFTSFLFISCNVDEEDKENIAENCDLETIRAQNSITDECRSAFEDALASAANNLDSPLAAMGQDTINGNSVLFLTGTKSTSNIKVEAQINGALTIVPAEDYQLKSFKDFSGTLLSLSAITDYSASMRDEDIDEALEVHTDIFNVFSAILESEIRLFSSEIKLKQDFTSDHGTLLSQIVRDDRFPRQSTALFDAIGSGLEALSKRESSMRLLVVATDGLENASTTYTTKEQIYELAQQHNIPIIALGALFADVGFMKELAEKTKGFYIYNRSFLDLKDDATKLLEMLSNLKAIEVTGSSWDQATSFQVTIDNQTLTFDLN